MPPHDFDPNTRQFVSNGRLVPRAEVRAEIEKLITHVQRESARIANRYQAGSITIGEFETSMRELLKAGHLIASSVGRGGRAQMSQADWGKVGSKIKWQYEYLSKFARRLATGKLDKAYSANRARSYASAIYISYSNGRAAAEQEFINNNGGKDADGSKIQVRLVTNSAEGCQECADDEAAGWMDPEDMGELGSRICGDFCKCTLEFEDEVEG